MLIDIPDDWLPTAANVNSLPEPIRRYIHDVETNCDPAGIVGQNTLLRDQVKQLQARLVLEREGRRRV